MRPLRYQEDDKALSWWRLAIPELRLSRAAALLLVQGLPLSRLFPPDVRFVDNTNEDEWVSFTTPIVLLKRGKGDALSTTTILTDLVLGVVMMNIDYSEEEARSIMLEQALNS